MRRKLWLAVTLAGKTNSPGERLAKVKQHLVDAGVEIRELTREGQYLFMRVTSNFNKKDLQRHAQGNAYVVAAFVN